MDPLPLAQSLIRCASVTPTDAGALDVLGQALEAQGFQLRRMKFGEVDNLYARRGTKGRNFCFAGHTDVVPIGDAAAWSVDPFAATVKDGWLIGRGAADMKAAIAAFAAATDAVRPENDSVSFLITGDEEGPAIDGTVRVLEALRSDAERIDHCLVGEPTSVDHVGDTVKNGRRGSLNCVLTAEGRQGHVAYPEQNINPVAALVELCAVLQSRVLDTGAPGFDPTRLEVTTMDAGNVAHNVVAARATAKLNIRFNTAHEGDDLVQWIASEAERIGRPRGVKIEARSAVTGRPFLTPPGAFTDLVQAAVRDATGAEAQLSTSGGTSDARFIRTMCPVIEFGLQNATAHMVDEKVRVDDVRKLAKAYEAILQRYFSPSP